MEQKGFYAVLRNFVRIADGRIARQEPWGTDEWSERTGLRTGKIIENVQRELRDAGFDKLAKEFGLTHRGRARIVRNAVAHGNFRTPHPDTGGQWVFGNYAGVAPNHLYMETTRLTDSEFRDMFLRFLAFRLAFFSATEEHEMKHAGNTFSFTSSNQMKPSEILKCQFDKGSLSIKLQGTPLW